MATITIDGVDYDTDTLSDQAKATIASLQFVDTQMQQLRNELAIADTARMAYARALKGELEKVQNVAEPVTDAED
jgi:lipid II:glycine glycyltransferase (peptidoglycan interpeptide bridge formation enzyme)